VGPGATVGVVRFALRVASVTETTACNKPAASAAAVTGRVTCGSAEPPVKGPG
jgi:hypothetical protein